MSETATGQSPPFIVCLAYGSLVWDPRTLPLDGGWRGNGPALPVEFARQADDGRITLVLLEGVEPTATFWTRLAVETLEAAVHALAEREACGPEWIGRVELRADSGVLHEREPEPPLVPERDAPGGVALADYGLRAPAAAIAEWGRARDLDAVVWAALPPRWGGVLGRAPSAAEAVAYARGLDGPTFERAREYVVRAPARVRTPVRSALEEALGWRSE